MRCGGSRSIMQRIDGPNKSQLHGSRCFTTRRDSQTWLQSNFSYVILFRLFNLLQLLIQFSYASDVLECSVAKTESVARLYPARVRKKWKYLVAEKRWLHGTASDKMSRHRLSSVNSGIVEVCADTSTCLPTVLNPFQAISFSLLLTQFLTLTALPSCFYTLQSVCHMWCSSKSHASQGTYFCPNFS